MASGKDKNNSPSFDRPHLGRVATSPPHNDPVPKVIHLTTALRDAAAENDLLESVKTAFPDWLSDVVDRYCDDDYGTVLHVCAARIAAVQQALERLDLEEMGLTKKLTGSTRSELIRLLAHAVLEGGFAKHLMPTEIVDVLEREAGPRFA